MNRKIIENRDFMEISLAFKKFIFSISIKINIKNFIRDHFKNFNLFKILQKLFKTVTEFKFFVDFST